jgi:hypothetical protein
MMSPGAGSRPIPCANPSCQRPFYPNRGDAAFCSVLCRLAEVTDRSGNPLGWIDVEDQMEPFPGVALVARIPAEKGELRDAARLAYTTLDARGLAETIVNTVRAVQDEGLDAGIADLSDVSEEPLPYIEVEGRQGPPRVVLSFWLPGKGGARNVLRMPHATTDAAELAELIYGVADRVALEVAAADEGAGAATLLEKLVSPSEDDADKG